MRTLVHLSDLHFGRTDASVVGELSKVVNGLRPDLVVVSGDLTQRTRRAQFREARAFLDTLPRLRLFVHCYDDLRVLHAFPPRRSSHVTAPRSFWREESLSVPAGKAAACAITTGCCLCPPMAFVSARRGRCRPGKLLDS